MMYRCVKVVLIIAQTSERSQIPKPLQRCTSIKQCLTAIFRVNLAHAIALWFSFFACSKTEAFRITCTGFTGQMLFLSPNQQCQSTQGKMWNVILFYVWNLAAM